MQKRPSEQRESGTVIDGPRGGAKPPIPPVPKLDAAQIQHLKSWASKHLQGWRKT